MRTPILPTSILLLSLLPSIALAAGSSYVHVRVAAGDEPDRVRLNLPMAAVKTLLPLMEDEHISADGHIEIDDWELGVVELRAILAGIRDAADGDLVTIKDEGTTLKVGKAEGYFLVVSQSPEEERVDVRIPMAVLEALIPKEGDRLDFAAALDALAQDTTGARVTVIDGDTRVSLWVDSSAE